MLDVVDQVMVMTINPGWGGQKLHARRCSTRCDACARCSMTRGLSPDIELDGGVKANNVGACIEAGADVLVCGSSVYNSEASPPANLRALRDAARADLARR